MELNIFKYSPKELSTDAFLNYFFLWAQENGFLEIIAEGFLVYSVDKDKSIKNLKVERQVSFGKKKADLVVDFELDGNIKSVLFENKTHTTTSQAQLSNYKKGEKKYKYNYLNYNFS